MSACGCHGKPGTAFSAGNGKTRTILNLLDYVIIDEASQVDSITGVFALSCCRNVFCYNPYRTKIAGKERVI